jgi:hypothetical protein
LIKLADTYFRFATKPSVIIGLIFAAKHQAAAPPELIESTDPHVCVKISYDRRRVGYRLVDEDNPERLASVAFSALEGLVAETKSRSVKTTITTARTKNRLVPKL